MKELSKKELSNIEGGAFNAGIALAIVAGITFIAGIIDGYVRPLACHK